MLLTITMKQDQKQDPAARVPATDLGYLLVKHPQRLQEFELAFGKALVFYPEASEERCTAALLINTDPVDVCRPQGGGTPWVGDYVNDRPYAASSHLSVAIARVLGSALQGHCQDRPELVETRFPLEARIETAPSPPDSRLIEGLFEPLGYGLETERLLLDPAFPEWGESRYRRVTVSAETTVRELLAHLYVMLPVLDNDKHYFVGKDEVEKLLRHGQGWLENHPMKEVITRRYLKGNRALAGTAMERLEEANPDEQAEEPEAIETAGTPGGEEAPQETGMGLGKRRAQAVLDALRDVSPKRVIDLDCGEGRLLAEMAREPDIRNVTGVEVSLRTLGRARRRLGREKLPKEQREKVTLLHGSLVYRDRRLEGFDAAVAMEVIEHIEPERLAAFEDAVLGAARPGTLIVTTPNAEYNELFEGMQPGAHRHRDHRFEWSRSEFQDWIRGAAGRNGYRVEFRGIGPEDEARGAPSQMAIFTRS